MFSGIGPEDLKEVEAIGRLYRLEKGNIIFFQDDPAERFYIVLSGKVKIAKTSPDGKEQILLLPGPGDSFGEAALFAEKKYPAAAEVIEDTEVMAFARKDFLNLIRHHPDVAVNMIARLSMLLHHLTQVIQRLSLEDVCTRLAGYILEQLPEKPSGPEATITLTEKKMILASLLGTIPETFSRALARLSKSGVVSVDGQKITVHDRSRLADIAAGEKI